jgi:hypothetical protein
MFSNCSGDAFTMGSAFTMPPLITTEGGSFASAMFWNCTGDAFTMNSVFNLPQGITTVGNSFAYTMFSGCSGDAFLVNEDFKFPKFGAIPSSAFILTFSLGDGANTQTRTAESIINGNGTPHDDRNTFGPSLAWKDYDSIAAYWKQE